MSTPAPVKPSSADSNLPITCGLFFVSGFPALIYQLVWQRSLFTIYGIDTESVTVVVTGFMAGLGLGSFFGGILSKRKPIPLLLMFSVIEFAIAAFGILSLWIFATVGAATLHASPFITKAAPLLLLLFPTVMMGATLPILVVYLVARSGNVGRSVGVLYFANTLGSAVACFVVAFWLMRTMGMRGSVIFAACFNVFAGLGALWTHYRQPRRSMDSDPAETSGGTAASGAGDATPFPAVLALALSALVGYISLSYEILWFRIFSFAAIGSAMSFPLLLGIFLIGIASGSFGARALCRSSDSASSQLRWLYALMLGSAVISFAVIPLTALGAGKGYGYILIMPPLVAVSAALMGGIFPLLSHVSIPPNDNAGRRVSGLYFANIAGSVAGSLVTGLVLADHFSLSTIASFLVCMGLGITIVLACLAWPRRASAGRIAGVAILAAAIILGRSGLFDKTYERLQKRSYLVGSHLTDVVENKSGIITVDDTLVVYDSSIYAGRIHVDLMDDKNRLLRPFSIGLFHPDAKDILVIGLGSGSWAQVVANYPGLRKLTVVDINPAYLSVIRKHSVVSSLLDNPKVEIVIDDGRRWLNRNPGRKFDVVIQNGTFFFRGNATNLLSREYLELVSSHLKPSGINMYNATASGRVERTACLANPETVVFEDMVVSSKGPLRIDEARWRKTLLAYQINGRPVLDMTQARHRRRLSEILDRAIVGRPDPTTKAIPLESCASILARTPGTTSMTDDNMGEEWSYWGSRYVFRTATAWVK